MEGIGKGNQQLGDFYGFSEMNYTIGFAAIRDELLPKLISVENRIKNIEN